MSVSQYLVSRNFRVTEKGSPSMETKHLVHFSSQISGSEVCSIASRRGAPYTAKPLFNWMTSHAWPSLNHRRPRVWGWWAETPAKLSLSTERLAKSDDAARRDEASRGRGGSTNDQTRPNVEFLLQAFGFQLRPTTQRPAPNRPRKRTAGAFPSCPLAEPGVEIMAQTDAGRSPPSPPCRIPNSSF